MRHVALDVHRDFLEVAIAGEGVVRRAPRVPCRREELEEFARILEPADQVVMEATGAAEAIAAILEPHVGRVVLVHPRTIRAIAAARAKTDRIDARTLAELSAAGFLPEVWAADEATRVLRRQIARRRQLVAQRTRAKNQVHAILARNLIARSPWHDPFGPAGLRWLDDVPLPGDERRTLDGLLRELAFVAEELSALDAEIARSAAGSPDVRRLMSVPGVNATTAATLMAAIGDVHRFPSPRHLVSYLGLDPRVRQSGDKPARHGGISKHGPRTARHALVEAAWSAARVPGPLHAFRERVRARSGPQVATVAVARKLAVIAWHLLMRGEDYAYGRPSLTRQKLRQLELSGGAPRRHGRREGASVTISAAQHELERELSRQAEAAYRRMLADRLSAGAGATRGRAS
jgi:transposase